MRKLIALIRNEFARELDSPMSWVFFLLLPLLFTAAVGAGLAGVSGNSDREPDTYRIDVAIMNQDEGELGQILVDSLATHDIVPERVETLPSDGYALRIPTEFTDRLIEGESVALQLQVPSGQDTTAAEQMLQAAIGRLNAAVSTAQRVLQEGHNAGIIETDRQAAFLRETVVDILDQTEESPVVTDLRWSGGAEIDLSMATTTGRQQASAGQLVTWVQITLLGAAEVLVAERMMGTLRRLLITPTHRATVLGGKLIARLMLGLTQMALLIVGGVVLFGVNWGDEPLAVALVSLAFATAIVSLGMLVATLVTTRSQANSVVIGLGMGLAALGGAWYPLEVTPPIYRQAVQILPSTWAMRAYTALLARGAGLEQILPEVLILFGFSALFSTVGVLRFRRY